MTTRRTKVVGLLLLVGLALLPGLVLTVLGAGEASSALVLGAFATLPAAVLAGPRLVLVIAALLGPAAALAVVASERAWLAALLMATAAGLAALAARKGRSGAALTAPIVLGFVVAEPPRIGGDLSTVALTIGALVLVGGLWTFALALVLRGRVHPPAPTPLSRSRTYAYAVTVALMVGISSWFVVDRQLGHGGAWLLMTLLVVYQPYLQDAWHTTVQRAAGTVAGFVVAMALSLVAGLPGLVYVIGMGLLGAALYVRTDTHRPYWQYVSLLTPAIVLLEGGTTDVVQTAIERLGFTLLGAAISVVVVIVLRPLYERAATRYGLDHY